MPKTTIIGVLEHHYRELPNNVTRDRQTSTWDGKGLESVHSGLPEWGHQQWRPNRSVSTPRHWTEYAGHPMYFPKLAKLDGHTDGQQATQHKLISSESPWLKVLIKAVEPNDITRLDRDECKLVA